MTALERVERAASALKVFPLPSAVLFPHTVLPLHIFEPRYRSLVKSALAGDKVMALAQLEPGWEGTYAGRPPMQPMVCAGLIAWHEELDGRALQHPPPGSGAGPASSTELPPDQLYREVRVPVLPDADYQGPEEEQLRQAVLELAGRVPPSFAEGLLPASPAPRAARWRTWWPPPSSPSAERRQELLCELDVRASVCGRR